MNYADRIRVREKKAMAMRAAQPDRIEAVFGTVIAVSMGVTFVGYVIGLIMNEMIM
jgi:hypothetical protein